MRAHPERSASECARFPRFPASGGRAGRLGWRVAKAQFTLPRKGTERNRQIRLIIPQAAPTIAREILKNA